MVVHLAAFVDGPQIGEPQIDSSPEPSPTTQHRDDQRRRRIELAILVAVVIVPLMLWLSESGLLKPLVMQLYRWSFYAAAWPVTVATQMLMTMALLLAWRYPLIYRPIWKPIAIVALALSLGPLFYVVSNLAWNWHGVGFSELAKWAFYDVLMASRTYLGALVLFVLIRRGLGVCVVERSFNDVPKRKPLSIAELLGWVTVCGIVFAASPVIIRVTGVSDTISVTYVVVQILKTALPVLAVVLACKWRWQIAIPLSVVVVFAVHASESWIFITMFGYPYQISYGNYLIETIISVTGIGLALWLIKRRGYRFKRSYRKQPAPTIQD